jgi:uracil phosphoribosyltransferase
LVQAKLSCLRDRRTGNAEFRRLVREVAGFLAVEVTRGLATRRIEVDTPLERTGGVALARPFTVVPILRAGLGIADGILALVPEAHVGHVGIYRDEASLAPVSYYSKFPPEIADGSVLLVDPMLATGGTACAAVDVLRKRGCREISLLCLVATPAGVARILERHPDVPVFAAGLDRELSRDGRILPGLGDAGDRMFGTERAPVQG